MNVICEYCGTSYALNSMTLVPSMLKCSQCGASVKVYQPHPRFEHRVPMTSGSSFLMMGPELYREFDEYTRSWKG